MSDKREIVRRKVDKEQFDEINKAAHYNQAEAYCSNCGHQIECIDVIRKMNLCAGNVIKYLWRSAWKGTAVKDVEKAVYYVNAFLADQKAEEQKHIEEKLANVDHIKPRLDHDIHERYEYRHD